MLLPLTVTEPEPAVTYLMPATPEIGVETVYTYVPFGSLNIMMEPVDVLVTPFSVMDHGVPEDRPVSVSVIV